MITALDKEIRRAAKSVAFQWPGIVDQEDVEQSLWLHLLERPGSVEKILGMEDDARYRAIIGIGHQLASKERTDYEHFSGNFRYSVKEVKALLSSGVLKDLGPGLASSWSGEEFYTKGGEFEDAVLTKNSMETDLLRGMAGLLKANASYYDAIRRTHLEDETSLEAVDRKRLERAQVALTTQMNRSFKRQHADRPDGPGTRRAISNSRAQRISMQQYSGAYDGTGAGWSSVPGEGY